MVAGDTVTEQDGLVDRLPEAAIKYLHVVTAFQASVIAVCGIPLAIWVLSSPWDVRAALIIGALAAISFIGEIAFLNPLRVRWTRYEVDRRAVRIHRGRLLKRHMVIPAAQLLNVTVTQGPLLERWGLAKVTFTCIAHPERLGPLSLADAERVRAAALSLYTGEGR